MIRRVARMLLPLLSLLLPISAHAAVLVSNIANATNGAFSPQSTFWIAQKFTTDAQTWTITSAQFRGSRNPAQSVALSIYSHDAVNDVPLASVATFDTSTVTTTNGVQTVAASGVISLAAGTTYWLVLAPSDVNTAFWFKTTDLTNAGSGTIDNRLARSTDGGASWAMLDASGDVMTLELDGTVQLPVDTTPDAFTFTDQTNVPLSSTITSNSITVSGINAPAEITVTGGTYSINGGAFTSLGGSVNNGDTVQAQHTSAATFSTNTDTTVSIGSVSDTFTSTTLAADTTPNAFAFTDQTNVPLSSVITSAAITVSGINTAAPISVTGGMYSINGGAFTAAAGTVNNGDTVRAQHTSSASFSTNTDTTVTIGGVSDTFTSTTLAADTTPNAFAFTDQTNVPRSSTITSNSITVSGINTAAPISVTGGTYSINGGPFTSVAGNVNNGDTVQAQHTSSASFSTNTDTAVTIGGVSDTFTSTTLGADTTPNAFHFNDQPNVPPSTFIVSNIITVSGIDSPAPISVTGGAYSLNLQPFTSAPGTVNNGDSVQLSHTSSASYGTATDTTVTIGGVSDTFTSTTIVGVPTLGNIGLALLALAMAGVAVLALRPRL
jgi:hypothetical protein